MLIIPKYHFELAREGIEYVWGIVKKVYIIKPLIDKTTKDKFHQCVKEAMNYVKVDIVRQFAAKARRYMLAYRNLDPNGISYIKIERFVKKVKNHRSVSDQDTGFIDKAWRDSIIDIT